MRLDGWKITAILFGLFNWVTIAYVTWFSPFTMAYSAAFIPLVIYWGILGAE